MKNKKTLYTILGVALGLIVGLTLAAYFTNDDLQNLFRTKPFNTSVTDMFISPTAWTPGDTTTKRVFATNESYTPVAVRISLEDNWTSANGNILPKYFKNEKVAKINFVNTDDWIKIGDYYYYDKILQRNESTSDFISSVTFAWLMTIDDNCTTSEDEKTITCYSSGDGYDNATYQIKFNIDMVQADAYKEIWNIDYDIGSGDYDLYFVDYLMDKANEDDGTLSYINGNQMEMYKFNHEATPQLAATSDYRYIGDNPNNYVYFNCASEYSNVTCQKWRIVGIFDVENEDGSISKKIKITYPMLNYNSNWTGNNNQWNGSNIQSLFNEGTFWTDLYPIAQSMISKSKFYLSSINSSTFSNKNAETWYTDERSLNNVEPNLNSIYENIALLYPSDYAYTFGKGISDTCYNDVNKCRYDNSDYNPRKSWIYNSSIYNGSSTKYTNAFLNPTTSTNYKIGLSSYGGVSDYSYISYYRPTLYLDSNIIYKSGDGSAESPYKIVTYEHRVINNDSNLNVLRKTFASDTVTLSHKNPVVYSVASFKLDGELINGNSFTMPDHDVTITDVEYQQIGYFINNDDDSIEVPAYAQPGDNIELSSSQYGIISFKLNGETVTGDSFTMPDYDVTISDIEKIEAIIVETSHYPYNNFEDDTVYFERTFDGASSITVILKYQTESVSYDWVYLYQDSDTIFNDKYGGGTLTTETITIPSNYLKIVFRSDEAVNNYYGFKAVIIPNY